MATPSLFFRTSTLLPGAWSAKTAPASESTATRLNRVCFMVRFSICCFRVLCCVMIGRGRVQNLSLILRHAAQTVCHHADCRFDGVRVLPGNEMVVVREHELLEQVALARCGKLSAQIVHVGDRHLMVLAALEHGHRHCERGQLGLQALKVTAKCEQFPVALPQ